MSEFLVYFGIVLVFDAITRQMYITRDRPWYILLILSFAYFTLLLKVLKLWGA